MVLWLEPGGVPATSSYELGAGSRLVATWHFIGIELYNVPAAALFQRGLVELLPLVPFTRDGQDFQTVERGAERVKEQAERHHVAELEALLAVFGARTFGDAAMQSLIRRLFMSLEILETSPLYQLWVKQAQEKGLAEGRAEGLREAMLVLRSRFGPLTPDLEQAVTTASVEQLEAALSHVATDTLASCRQQFGLVAE